MLDSYMGNSDWFPFLLLGTGIFFTIYLRFPQIRFFRHATQIVTGKYEKETFKGDTTHFQSLATALSGTVGTGNIAGVGLAIWTGGPAALFWMWATAFFGMTSKFVECTLSHKYRNIEKDGSIAGGPMYYMENKLKWKWMAVLFAIATVVCSIGTGNMPQINNISTSVFSTFNIQPWITGGFLAILLAMIIIGGIKRIAKVTEKVVPIMSILYVVGAFSVILVNLNNIIPAFKIVFTDLFTGTAAVGGFLGSTFAYVFNKGVQRGIYSNEAGQGSAAIAHSAAKADEPVSEGMVAILEPFIDTLIICTLTGLAILASGVWTEKVQNEFQRADLEIIQGVYLQDNPEHINHLRLHVNNQEGDQVKKYTGELQVSEGKLTAGQDVTVMHAHSIAEDVVFMKNGKPLTGKVAIADGQVSDLAVRLQGKSLVHSAVLTNEAFKRGMFGDWGMYIATIGLLLFAFSTVISWSYYGDRAVTYLLGSKFVMPYRILYVVAFFVAALIDTTIIWNIAYVVIIFMTVPNLIGILVLHKDMKQSIKDYWKKFLDEHPEDAAKINVLELRQLKKK